MSIGTGIVGEGGWDLGGGWNARGKGGKGRWVWGSGDWEEYKGWLGYGKGKGWACKGGLDWDWNHPHKLSDVVHRAHTSANTLNILKGILDA